MFAAEGAVVAISDLKVPNATAAEIGASAYQCDVSEETSVKQFISDVKRDHGLVDVYLSNAGIGSGLMSWAQSMLRGRLCLTGLSGEVAVL